MWDSGNIDSLINLVHNAVMVKKQPGIPHDLYWLEAGLIYLIKDIPDPIIWIPVLNC